MSLQRLKHQIAFVTLQSVELKVQLKASMIQMSCKAPANHSGQQQAWDARECGDSGANDRANTFGSMPK